MPIKGFQVHKDRNLSLHLWTKQKIKKNMYLKKLVLEQKKFYFKINCFPLKIFFQIFWLFLKKFFVFEEFFLKKFCCLGPN